MPAAAVASRAPSIAGMSGTVCGARGETWVDMGLARDKTRYPEVPALLRGPRRNARPGPGPSPFEGSLRSCLRVTVEELLLHGRSCGCGGWSRRLGGRSRG